MTTLKELRQKNRLTQLDVSKITNIPLRTYKLYENDSSKIGTIKYNYILETLKKYVHVDETHGILSLDDIKKGVYKVLSEYDVDYAILFGSYAKGTAVANSDIDLVISTNVTGLKFYGIVENLRNELKKRIDLLDLKQITNNESLLKDVLGDGIRIYVKDK